MYAVTLVGEQVSPTVTHDSALVGERVNPATVYDRVLANEWIDPAALYCRMQHWPVNELIYIVGCNTGR